MKKSNLQHTKPTEHGFKIPKGYFDSVEDAVFTTLSSKKFPIKEGHTTPENYFENVEDTILKKIQKEKHKKTHGFSMPKEYLETLENSVLSKLNTHKSITILSFKKNIFKRVIPLAVAASLLILLFFNYQQKSINMDVVTSIEIEQWIENDLITLDSYELTEVFYDTDLENTPIFKEEELIEYLNGIDIESILLENE